MFADLHLHSTFSDGTYSPEEIVRRAQAARLVALALTDHDTVEGCARLEAACQAARLESLTGTELTGHWQGQEIHLLGYGFSLDHAPFLEQMAKFQETRQGRIVEMVQRLNRLGVPLELNQVLELAQCRSPGRPHVARALVKLGICHTLEEAFERFLRKNGPAWVPKFKISAPDAMRLVHAAGGKVAMAHPGITDCDPLIPSLVDEGLDGLECFHTRHTSVMVERYLRLAAEHCLFVTGGSDCHGLNKGAPLLGGSKLPYSYFALLKASLTKGAPLLAGR
jgi:predicted metal-dependent phosphoesterase TrpH